MAIKEDLMKIKNELLSFIKHSYLMEHITEPYIDEDKLMVLYLMFKENGEYDAVNQLVVTVMLVQIALDIHDTIHIYPSIGQKEVKQRQLTVLAGDYYSSLYYRILAQLSDARMTTLLAESIQVINEKKMALYNNLELSIDEKVNLLKRIESELMTRLATQLNLTDWQTIMEDFFVIKRLYLEQQMDTNHQFSLFFQSFPKMSYPKTQVYEQIEYYIDGLKRSLISSLKNQPLLSKHLNTQAILLTEADLCL